MCPGSHIRSPRRDSSNWYHFEERNQFLSRDSGGRTGHAILAAQPQEASETVAGARRQGDHDPADAGPPVAPRIRPQIMDHYQSRSKTGDCQTIAPRAQKSVDRRAHCPEHSPGHRVGSISSLAPFSLGGALSVSFVLRYIILEMFLFNIVCT